MLVKSLEGTDEGSGVLKDHPHPVVDPLGHFVVASDNHDGIVRG